MNKELEEINKLLKKVRTTSILYDWLKEEKAMIEAEIKKDFLLQKPSQFNPQK